MSPTTILPETPQKNPTVLEVDVLEAGKMAECKDLSDVDKGQACCVWSCVDRSERSY